MSNKKVLIAGFPSAGKTTFISALWYHVTHAKNEDTLILNSLEKGDHEYLNKISIQWANYEPVARNQISTSSEGEKISMNLKIVKTDEVISLDIPDFSGEIFNAQIDQRVWTKEYDLMLSGINGLIFFVSPLDEKNMTKLIFHENQYIRSFGGDIHSQNNENQNQTNWSINSIPNQVKTVEILQFLLRHKRNIIPLKVALVVSAWDLVIKSHENLTPQQWIRTNMPLLDQFIMTNSESFIFKFYGISSQGVDYSNKKQTANIIKLDPMKRMIVQVDNDKSNDIALPIIWATT
jgi:Double-GTPase 1